MLNFLLHLKTKSKCFYLASTFHAFPVCVLARAFQLNPLSFKLLLPAWFCSPLLMPSHNAGGVLVGLFVFLCPEFSCPAAAVCLCFICSHATELVFHHCSQPVIFIDVCIESAALPSPVMRSVCNTCHLGNWNFQHNYCCVVSGQVSEGESRLV